MSDPVWLSYSLQDFIMFGPQVFLRLFVRINQDLWPWLWLFPVAGLLAPLLARNSGMLPRRAALALVGLAWVASGYLFLIRYYGPINTPAEGFGWAFVVQGAVLVLLAIFGQAVPRALSRTSTGLWLLLLVGLPWLPVLEAADWRAPALFGVAPGATVAASVLLLGQQPKPWRWLLLVLPLLWMLFSAATYWALGTLWLLGFPAATLIALIAGLRLSPTPARSSGRQSVRPGQGHRSP